MRLKVLIGALVLVLVGCTVKTQIIEPDGSTYTVKSGSDALVTIKSAGRETIVDNRGNPNIFESLLGWMLLKTPEIVQAEHRR